MKKSLLSVGVLVAAVAASVSCSALADSCITAGAENMVSHPAVDYSKNPVALVTGGLTASTVPASTGAVETRVFSWDFSQAIDILTDKLGALLFLR